MEVNFRYSSYLCLVTEESISNQIEKPDLGISDVLHVDSSRTFRKA